ncbi:PspC domain-containing protein [Erysipelothrix sp. HDW6C]|uniref:PspC domain-containing protein n=1 Tax=Erysipelothrix sp. HDW6C TaxID=2714930 RepID=UPI00140940EC|nr:PspC domain-containing protein [Erysipelothrix sp. HDW6C]QIK68809.1 PspC domain-containing protein [Erysipelothrix sp. HDW6C]
MAYHSNKRLYKDKSTGMVAGVCAGLSEYFKIDVTIIRFIFALLVLGYGTGFLVYILLWFLLPDKSDINPYE